jgi:hypothetical protein
MAERLTSQTVEAPAHVEEGPLPAPLERPMVRRLWSGELQWIVGAIGFAIIGIEAVLLYQLVTEGFTPAAWARFLLPNVLASPPIVRQVVRSIRARLGYLVLREHSLGYRQGASVREIQYRDISGYWMRDKESPWLRIATKDGRELEVSGTDFAWGRPPTLEVIRVLGPRVSTQAIQERGECPEDPMAARLWRHYGDPPPVAMVPGWRYRYVKGFAQAVPTGNIFALFCLPGLPGLLPKGYLGLLTLVAFTVGFIGLFLWRIRVYAQGASDRFELSPEGLWVTRGERRWLAKDLRPAKTFPFRYILHGKPMLRYGRGFRTNLFDPRFIEEDDGSR